MKYSSVVSLYILFQEINFCKKILYSIGFKKTFSDFPASFCYQNNKKQTTEVTLNLKLQFYDMWMLLQTFYENRAINLCTGAHESILIHYGLCTELVLHNLDLIIFGMF